jgi:hypothetical protein
MGCNKTGFKKSQMMKLGHAVAQLKNYATSLKVAGSISDEITDFFSIYPKFR